MTTLGALYFFLFGALGLMTPLAPLAFEARGLGEGTIAVLVTLAAVARVSTPPLTGPLADRHGRRRAVVVAGLVAAGAAGLLAGAETPVPVALTYALYVAAASTQVPLTDVLAHRALAPRSERFAWVRVWGSIGFTISVVAGGYLAVTRAPPIMFLIVAGAHLLTSVIATRLELDVAGHGPRVSRLESLRGAFHGGLGPFLAATGLHYFGFGVYDAYFGLHLRGLGYDDGFIGTAVGVGVVAEIGLMILAPRHVARAGVEGARWLATIGAVAGAVRWGVLASTDNPTFILAVQPLHALSFGLWYLAVVAHVQGRAPETAKASLQGAAVAVIGIGALAGSGVGGLAVAEAGPWAAFTLAAASSALAAGVYLGRRPPHEPSPSSSSGPWGNPPRSDMTSS